MGMNLREMINGKRLVTTEIKVVGTQDVFELEYMALQWVD